jgi:hypothetical protein
LAAIGWSLASDSLFVRLEAPKKEPIMASPSFWTSSAP